MHSKSPVLVDLRSYRQVVQSRESLSPRDVRDRTRSRVYRLSVRTALFAAVALSAPGCSDDDNITTPTPEDPRKTIAGVMRELIDAYEAQDIDRYSALFDQANFMFVFDPVDVQEDPDIPPNWDWPEEHNSSRNLFEAELVERIQVDYVPGAPVAVTEPDMGERPFPEGTMKVTVSDVSLDIDTRDPAGGENIVYRVSGDQAIFFVYPDSVEIVDGVPVWKIFEWRDKKVGAFATSETSWGQIKANYH